MADAPKTGWPPAGDKGKTITLDDAVCADTIDPAYQGKNALKKGSN